MIYTMNIQEISRMNNKEIAFTIVDTDNDVDRDIINTIEQDDCK